MVIFVLKTQSRRSPVPVSRTQPKRPHAPKPDLTMPAAPRPFGHLRTRQAQARLAPSGGDFYGYLHYMVEISSSSKSSSPPYNSTKVGI